jgi:hypothetical protein
MDRYCFANNTCPLNFPHLQKYRLRLVLNWYNGSLMQFHYHSHFFNNSRLLFNFIELLKWISIPIKKSGRIMMND